MPAAKVNVNKFPSPSGSSVRSNASPVVAHTPAPAPTPLPQAVPMAPPTIPKARALYPYEPQHPGDLKLVPGAEIELIKTDGGWWEGLYQGERGIFPANYVERI